MRQTDEETNALVERTLQLDNEIKARRKEITSDDDDENGDEIIKGLKAEYASVLRELKKCYTVAVKTLDEYEFTILHCPDAKFINIFPAATPESRAEIHASAQRLDYRAAYDYYRGPE